MKKKRTRSIKPDMPRAKVKKKVKKSQAPSVKTDQQGENTESGAPGKPKKSAQRSRKTVNRAKSDAKGATAKTVAPSRLPEEYGENDLFLIVVNPDVVYASWEIKREDMPRRGRIRMRFLDVTGNDFADDQGESFLDIALAARIGNGFFEIGMNGREVVAEIGNIRRGRFVPIIRSHRVSFPMSFFSGKLGIKGESEVGLPVGY
jgi:hypothetical protein